jgi:hypothetical protein
MSEDNYTITFSKKNGVLSKATISKNNVVVEYWGRNWVGDKLTQILSYLGI